MTTPQSSIVPITAETVVRELSFPAWLYDSLLKQWWRCAHADGCDKRRDTHWHPDQQNPPDRMPGAVEEMTPARVHDLKTWPAYFDAVFSGAKTFEIRKNDRGFLLGDVLLLREWDNVEMRYTGRECKRVVSYITNWEQRDGFVVMSITAPTPTASGDPCARAAEAVLSSFHVAYKGHGFVDVSADIAAIIRREVAGHYEKEIERLSLALTAQTELTANYSASVEKDGNELLSLRARLATAERERDEERRMRKTMEGAHGEVLSDCVALRARLSAAEADSKRYQYIRMNWDSWTGKAWSGSPEEVAKKLDAAIDAARQQHKEE